MTLEFELTKNPPSNVIKRGLRAKCKDLLHDSDFGIVNKKEIIKMAKVVKEGSLHEKVGDVEYKMPKAMADALLKDRKGDDKKMRPQDYLIQVVNDNFGLLYHCSKVIVY